MSVFVESVCNYSTTVDGINVIPQVFFIVFLLISKSVAVHIIYGNKHIINSCYLFFSLPTADLFRQSKISVDNYLPNVESLIIRIQPNMLSYFPHYSIFF
jgi:hypothetical protein